MCCGSNTKTGPYTNSFFDNQTSATLFILGALRVLCNIVLVACDLVALEPSVSMLSAACSKYREQLGNLMHALL
jgi:hypothetical protein